MTDSWSRAATAVLLLSAAVGCDHVGRAIVGEESPPGPGSVKCGFPVRCGTLMPDEPVDLPGAPTAFDLAGCVDAVPRCIDGLGAGSRAAPNMGCIPANTPTSPTPTLWAADGLRSLSCGVVEWQAAAAVGGEPLRARSVALQQVNIRLQSATPLEVELRDSELQQVSFELHGPIVLKLIDNRSVKAVRVAADGGARIELEGGRCSEASLVSEGGVVALRRVELERLQVRAQRVEFESVQLRDAAVTAGEFDATDSTMQRIAVTADRNVLSSCVVTMGDFAPGIAFTSVMGSFNRLRLAAGAEPARIYGSSVDDSRLEGELVLDQAAFTHDELGQPDAAALQVWNSTLTNTTFCGDGQPLKFGGDSIVLCAHCDLAEQPLDVDACAGIRASVDVSQSESCPGLVEIPACTPDPKRMRPSAF